MVPNFPSIQAIQVHVVLEVVLVALALESEVVEVLELALA